MPPSGICTYLMRWEHSVCCFGVLVALAAAAVFVTVVAVVPEIGESELAVLAVWVPELAFGVVEDEPGLVCSTQTLLPNPDASW
jgi:hypothetical protein